MCISLFKSVFEKLKVTFSLKKTNSPTKKSSAMASNGNATSNTGNNCKIQMAGRDITINYLTENRNSIENSEAFDALLNCFTEDNALRLIEIIKDPRYQTYLDQNIKGKKNG
ncbi:MAG: hypothetical protein K1000chlam1_01250 [Candidatus Anoxychlamydiales bacterium]|nr:hypothetical protein [Candidatus Anoxychlamydiales bacterium]